jgi:hypothetical protein
MPRLVCIRTRLARHHSTRAFSKRPMSYFTEVEFLFSDEAPPFEVVADCARAEFDAIDYGVDDLVDILRGAWEDGKAEFNRMECSDIERLMCRVSQRFPASRMCVRGSGEEWRDFWLREFEGGKVVFSAGPLLEEKSPAFFTSYFGEKPNQVTPPNGGPAESQENSSAGGGPPSVS